MHFPLWICIVHSFRHHRINVSASKSRTSLLGWFDVLFYFGMKKLYCVRKSSPWLRSFSFGSILVVRWSPSLTVYKIIALNVFFVFVFLPESYKTILWSKRPFIWLFYVLLTSCLSCMYLHSLSAARAVSENRIVNLSHTAQEQIRPDDKK